MKKNSVKKIMLLVVLMFIVCFISNINYATGDYQELLEQMGLGNETIQNITRIDETPTTTENTTTVPTTNETTNETTKTETTLPKTGVDDTMLWVLIAVSVVAAGYTYKKVRDYNV